MPKSAKIAVASLDRSPSHLLHRALQLALDIYGEETGSGVVTQRQYAVLAAVSAHEGLTQTDLVRATGIDRSTLADMIARMIAKDYLVRERSTTDGRANTVRLTDIGRAVLEAVEPQVSAADQRILALLSSSKRDAFINQLRDLAKAGEKSLVGSDEAAKPEKKKKSVEKVRDEKAKSDRKKDKKAQKQKKKHPEPA